MYHIVKVKENSNYSRKDKYYTNQYVQIYFEREQKIINFNRECEKKSVKNNPSMIEYK